ncbi:hypothetical protein [Xylanimonas sp. McL0601]|uniref:hypothetical protein n=1 Tax=Xylanimonas sp. McL0601 TaxID=3414739 RepID=UPI003CF37C62
MSEAPAGLDVGSTLTPAMLSLCAGGLVRTWTEVGARLWSVEDDSLRTAMYEGRLARTPREDRRFREVALLDEEQGVLVLAPLIRAAGGADEFSLDVAPLTLRPAGEPNDEVMDDVADALVRAIGFTVSSGGFLLVEKGGWDAPEVPYCLFVVDDDAVHIETAPAPHGAKVWAEHVRPGAPGATVSAPMSDDVLAVAWRIVLDAVATWGVSPWELALTFGVR